MKNHSDNPDGALKQLIEIARNITGDFTISYSEPEDCFECEMFELCVVPEKKVYIKRCHDLWDFVSRCKKEWNLK